VIEQAVRYKAYGPLDLALQPRQGSGVGKVGSHLLSRLKGCGLGYDCVVTPPKRQDFNSYDVLC